jgi:hypothetical protein
MNNSFMPKNVKKFLSGILKQPQCSTAQVTAVLQFNQCASAVMLSASGGSASSGKTFITHEKRP